MKKKVDYTKRILGIIIIILMLALIIYVAYFFISDYNSKSGTVTGTLVDKNGFQGFTEVVFMDTYTHGEFMSVTLENFSFTGNPIQKGIDGNRITITNSEHWMPEFKRLKVGLDYTICYHISDRYVDELNGNLIENVWFDSFERAKTVDIGSVMTGDHYPPGHPMHDPDAVCLITPFFIVVFSTLFIIYIIKRRRGT